MNTGEDGPSSGLNGRLRPRKSNNPSPQANKVLRKSDGKSLQDKPKRSITPSKVTPNKTEDPVNKSDNTPIPLLLCPYCDKKFVSKQTVSKHARRIHFSSSKQDSFIECLFCNHSEAESIIIIRHMVDSHPNQYFACLDCHTRFSSTSDLAEHKLNVCEKQKLPYRSKLRQKSSEAQKSQKPLNKDGKSSLRRDNKDYPMGHGFNGIVISCELKPTHVHDEADIEDNITTNVILPPAKGIGNNALIEKNAVIVLDDIQWNKRIPSNFTFHNTDADQILSRLGVVHRSPRTGESTKRDWLKTIDDATQKFEKCFDTSFYTKVASNVQENLSKYLDGSFNANPDPDSTIKTRKAKNCVAINTAEGFPILLACEQYSRNLFDGYMPRAIAPKHKWKWDSPDNDRGVINPDQIKRDSHLNNCIITLVSNLDIWTQLRMRRKFEEKFNSLPLEKKTEKQNTIGKELKEILESREIPTTSSQTLKYTNKPVPPGEGCDFPASLGLTQASQTNDLQPTVLSGEWVRPRCYVCCACGAQTRDSRALSSHISTQHPNAFVQHYEIVGEPLLNADILKHLYVPPSQTLNRTRPLRGFRECTKCKKSVTLEDLHQHMLDCAGDMPTVRRKCRHRPFGVRKRRPRLPDNRIRKKMRKDIRTGQTSQKNHMRPRTRIRSEVGDAETIRRMLADLPAKRHRVMVNPLSSVPRKKLDRKRNKLMKKKHSVDDAKLRKTHEESTIAECVKSHLITNQKECTFNNDEDDDDNLPLRPKISLATKSSRQKESLNRKAIMNRSKRKLLKGIKKVTEKDNEAPVDIGESSQPEQLSIDNTSKRINVNDSSCNSREQANRGGSNNSDSNNRDDQRPGCSRQSGNSNDSIAPSQNIPLKHSIARLTADSETHDKSVQFHRLFLVQQECNNVDHHLPSDRRVLFENEAVVTKLDKPPLHFNQMGVLDDQNPRRNKSSKPRKGLNDCIAMLKNKLVPTIDGNLPGHVSVQCGSDEPIEPEPVMEQRSPILDTKNENPKKSVEVLPVCISKQERSLIKGNDEQEKSCKSNLGVMSGAISLNSNKMSDLQLNKHCLGSLPTDQENSTLMQKQNNTFAKCESTRWRPVQLENEISQMDLPLLPPRNTVIRKSPKMTVNLSIQQEESKTQKFREFTSQLESNDKTKQNLSDNYQMAELPRKVSQVVLSEFNARQQYSLNVQNHTDVTNNNLAEFSPSFLQSANIHVNITDLERVPSEETEIQKNLDLSCKMNVEYSSTDFHNIPVSIPPAHASTTVESILSTPLDLSGKNFPMDASVNSSQEISFTSNYDNYETLDLSHKSLSVGQSFEENEINHMDITADVVVDLSVKPLSQTALQSIPANLSKKSAIIDDTMTDLSFESVNENVPTDLSVKKRDRITTLSGDLTTRCEFVNFVQDLSSHKNKQKETVHECVIEIEHEDKDKPTDLSGRRVINKSTLKEITPCEKEMKLNIEELNKEDSQANLSKNIAQNTNITYIDAATKITQDVGESFIVINDEDEEEIHDNATIYYSQSSNDDQSPNSSLQKSVYESELTVQIIQNSENLLESNDIITINDNKNYDEIVSACSIPTVSDSTRDTEIIFNQSLASYSENTNFAVPHENSCYENGKSTLSDAISTITGTVPLYTVTNRSVTTYVPVCKFESTTPVYTLANACISVTKVNTSSTAALTNTLLSIPGTTIASTTSVYTLAGTTVDTTVNHGTVSVPPQIKCGNDDINERSLSLSDRDSSLYIEGLEPQKTTNKDKFKEDYDLTKEEIIDCDLEQDTETARKIAMLPKELVEILGTMPIDHRNQLLNVLPQYVSSSASVAAADTTQCFRNNSPSVFIRTPSPVRQQILTMENNYGEEITDTKNINHQGSISTPIKSMSHSSKFDAISTSACPLLLQVSSPQTINLKTFAVPDDHKPASLKYSQFEYCSSNNLSTNSMSFSNQQCKLISPENMKDAIIDLTDEENLQYLQDDVQVIDDDVNVTSTGPQKHQQIEVSSKSSIQKGSNDQTASLRAVRIKAPSERNKQVAPENRAECETEPSPLLIGDCVFNGVKSEQIINKSCYDDENQTEACKTQNGTTNIASDIDVVSPKVSQILKPDLIQSRDMPFVAEEAQAAVHEVIQNVKIMENSTITIPLEETNVSPIKRCDELTCSHLKNTFVNSSEDKVDKINILDVNDTNEYSLSNLTLNDNEKAKLLSDQGDCLPQTRIKEKIINADEDSEDDISLAVIVKQKQRDQSLILSFCDKNSDNNTAIDGKKRKKDKRGKKSDSKEGNDEVSLKKNTNSLKESENVAKNLVVSQGTIKNKTIDTDSIKYRKQGIELNIDKYIDYELTGSNSRKKTRKSRRHIAVTKCVEDINEAQKNYHHKYDINKNNDAIAECSTKLKYCEEISKTKKVEYDNYNPNHEDNEKRTIDNVDDIACRSPKKLTENVEILNDINNEPQKERVDDNGSITKKESSQKISKLTCHPSSCNNSVEEKNYKDHKDVFTEEAYNNTHKCCQFKQLMQFNNIIIEDDSKISESVVSPVCESNYNCSVDKQGNKLHHEPINNKVCGSDPKSKKSARIKKNKNTNSMYSSISSQNEVIESGECLITPLRRSRRGKSMFVDRNIAEPDTSNQTDNNSEQKAPLTKKQLIFSKLLLDEENLMKPTSSESVSRKEPIVVISNIKLSNAHALSSVFEKDNEAQQSFAERSKEIKGSKRKKSPQPKRKFKKLRSLQNSRNSDSCMLLVSKNDNENIRNFEKESRDVDGTLQNSRELISLEDNKTPPTLEHGDFKQNVESIVTSNNEINRTKTSGNINKDQDYCLDQIHTKSRTNCTEKRKISCTLTGGDIMSSISKKSKLSSNIECVSESIKSNELKLDSKKLEEEICRKSTARNVFEIRNKTGCNTHVAARRTRSKSVVVKSSTLLYDPYDIDLEDMIDKTEPFERRLISTDKAFNNISFMRGHEFKKRNKSETSVGVNTEPMINGDFCGNVQVQSTNNIDCKGGISDSDDSSKSDVPLKKYVEEKERKNLESCITNNLRDCDSVGSDHDQQEKSEKKVELKGIDKNDVSSSSQQETEQQLKSEQFMESFGFFSERKPRKSNLLATKKISETFHTIANETDEVNCGAKERTTKRSSQSETTKSNEDESSSRDSSQSPTKKATKRGRKKAICSKFVTCYCVICKKEFRRPDNYLRHQMTLLHISKLSEVEMKIKTTPVHEEPNYLLAYKQQLDRLKILTDKIAKRKKNAKPTSKFTLPTLEEILANVNRTVREQQLSRRNLSRDEALFLDCCELLKESHKPEIPNTSNLTITSDVNNIVTPQASVAELSGLDKNDEKYDTRSDGDVDSITAKNILESEEVRNLENDLISGLKEAAANSLTHTANHIGFQQAPSEMRSDQKEENDEISRPREADSCTHEEPMECSQETLEEPVIPKPKKNNEVKDKMYPDIIENIDIFEDKFDKIKRKCRSQAAAAKQIQPVVETTSSHKGRKKSEKKKGKKSSKKNYQNTVLTKGALKGFDGIKVSIPTSDINISAIVPSIETSSKKKKKYNSKKKKEKMEVELKSKNNTDYKHKGTPQKVDVYEFMDNEDAELFEFRPSTLMERFKNINSKDLPSTSKFVPESETIDFSSESGSDGDDFVYDDYVCSDDETENSLMSCELGNGKVGSESKKSSPSLKRKDAIEKNAVMGKIFKHNAVRTEKKSSKIKEYVKAKANLDQLFDSLLEDEPSSSSLNSMSPRKDELMSPSKHESASPRKFDTTSSRYDSEKPSTSTSYKKDLGHSSKRRDNHLQHTKYDKPSSSKKSHSTSPRVFFRTSPKKHDSRKYVTSSIECEPSTSKNIDGRRHSSKKYHCISPRKDCSKSSPKRYDGASRRRNDTVVSKKYDHDSPAYRNDSYPRHSKDKSPLRQFVKDFVTIDDDTLDTMDDTTSDDAGVARQRARRKCTVGKQNVLAETWSSESEPDGGPPRPNSAESVVSVVGRKKRGKKKEGHSCGMRKGISRQMPIKRQDVERRVNPCHRSTSSASSSSSGISRPSTSGMCASSATTTSVSVLTSPGSHVPLGPPGPKVRPRSATYYWSSEGDEEQEHLQQHGWIVGDSHKKLVTMLAHAKGRKRNNDEKRHLDE